MAENENSENQDKDHQRPFHRYENDAASDLLREADALHKVVKEFVSSKNQPNKSAPSRIEAATSPNDQTRVGQPQSTVSKKISLVPSHKEITEVQEASHEAVIAPPWFQRISEENTTAMTSQAIAVEVKRTEEEKDDAQVKGVWQ